MPVRGRDMMTSLPKTIQISSLEVYDAMAELIQAIVDTVPQYMPDMMVGDV